MKAFAVVWLVWAGGLVTVACADATGLGPAPIECDVPSARASRADSSAPTLDEVTVTPCPVDLSQGEVTVVFSLRARSPQSGIRETVVSGTTPAGVQVRCGAVTSYDGTSRDGRWQCAWVLNRYAEPGSWTVRASVWDSAGNRDTLGTTLPVRNARPDTLPPVLTGLVFSDERIIAGSIETRDLIVAGSDSAAGMWRVEIGGVQEDGTRDWSCSAEVGVWPDPQPSPDAWSPQVAYSPGCPMELLDAAAPTYWTIREVRLIDLRRNERVYDELDLEQSGFITRINVSK